MAIEFRLVNMKEFTGRLKEIDKAVQVPIAKKAVNAGGEVISAHAKINLEAHKLRKQGLLINSVKVYDLTVDKGKVWCFVGSRGVVYARIHEFGGTIVAKRVANLAIPVTEAAKKAGSPRKFGGKLKFIPSRSRGGVLIDKSGTVHYVLKPSVRIPMRAYLRPAIDEHKKEVKEAFQFQINKGLQEFGR